MPDKSTAGYTIVELMIVLAVSAIIAIGAFSAINGQRQRNEFSLGVRDFEQTITDIANDVSQGYFPNQGNNILCTAGSGITFTDVGQGGKDQGNNADCLFAAKVIEFQPDNDDSLIRVHTVASRRLTPNDKLVTSLNDLKNGDIAGVAVNNVPRLEETFKLSYGMRVLSVKANGASNRNAVSFLSGFGNKAAIGTKFTGSTPTNLYFVNGSYLGQSVDKLLDQLKKPASYQSPNAYGIEICLEHGRGGKKAKIILGLQGQTLNTKKEMDISTC